MKILSSFTHPQVSLNLYEFLSSVEHKRKVFLRMLLTKHLTVATDLHSIEKSKSMATINYLDTNFIQNIFFLCSTDKKETHKGTEQVDGG